MLFAQLHWDPGNLKHALHAWRKIILGELSVSRKTSTDSLRPESQAWISMYWDHFFESYIFLIYPIQIYKVLCFSSKISSLRPKSGSLMDSNRKYNTGNANKFSKVEVTKPHRMTIAS